MTDTIITGIDVGSSKVATIIAKLSEDEETPRIMGFSSVPSRGVKRGTIVDINKVTETVEKSVEKAERMAGVKISSAFVTVGGPHIESLNSQGVVAVSHPEVEIGSEDIDRVVDAARAISLSSTREVIEVLPREFIVDGQGGINNPVGMSGVRLEVNTHIITASVTNLKNLERCLSDLGIDTEDFVFSSLSSVYSAVSDTERELGVAVIDLGGGKIDICVYVEGSLSYSTSIPIGARHITNDIAVGLRISLESAEKIKLMLSKIDTKELSARDEIDISKLALEEGLKKISYKTVVDGIIRPRLEEMFEEVLAKLETESMITQIPSGLVITGGGALTVGAIECAKRVIGLPARIGTPSHVTGLVDEVLFPQYTAVVGLLLYGKNFKPSQSGAGFKDFDKIFRNFSMKSSMRKMTDLVKSLIP